MPNQLNYPERLVSTHSQRPDRLSKLDLDLMQVTTKQILFGVTARDVVETWIYHGDGTIAGHLNIFPTDPDLSLVTFIDQGGAQELSNVNMVAALNRMNIQPGT